MKAGASNREEIVSEAAGKDGFICVGIRRENSIRVW